MNEEDLNEAKESIVAAACAEVGRRRTYERVPTDVGLDLVHAVEYYERVKALLVAQNG